MHRVISTTFLICIITIDIHQLLMKTQQNSYLEHSDCEVKLVYLILQHVDTCIKGVILRYSLASHERTLPSSHLRVKDFGLKIF